MEERSLRLAICAIVSLGWLFNLVAPAFTAYESRLEVNGPMLLVIGALFPRKSEKLEGKKTLAEGET